MLVVLAKRGRYDKILDATRWVIEFLSRRPDTVLSGVVLSDTAVRRNAVGRSGAWRSVV